MSVHVIPIRINILFNRSTLPVRFAAFELGHHEKQRLVTAH
jgi:hypothetical protein